MIVNWSMLFLAAAKCPYPVDFECRLLGDDFVKLYDNNGSDAEASPHRGQLLALAAAQRMIGLVAGAGITADPTR